MAESHNRTNNTPGSSDSNEIGNFECNICFELAQDPVITLCGHLYCWPCLYKWIRGHSRSQECPVCKALIEEENVIPLYGRGKNPTDPRSKPVPGFEIPNRPAGQRPENVPPPEYNFAGLILGLMGGFVPIASVTFNNFGMYTGFGGVFSPIFGVQFSNFGGSSGHRYGYNGSFRDSEGRVNRGVAGQSARVDDENLMKILFIIIFCVIFAFLMV